MSSILALALLLTFFGCVFAPPPGLYDGQRWVPNDGCPRGGVYFLQNRSIRCHCWGFQGYICEPDGRSGRGFGGSGGNGNGCPPGSTVCVINNNSNSNSNSNTNANSNANGNRNGNGNKNPDYGSDYANYDG